MDNINLSNQVVLITGAAGQLGQVIVKGLILSGAKVVALDNSIDKLDKFIEKNNFDQSNISIVNADVREINQVRKAFEVGVNNLAL